MTSMSSVDSLLIPKRTVIVTGSTGYLGLAICRLLKDTAANAAIYTVIGIDKLPGPHTTHVGDIAEAAFISDALRQFEEDGKGVHCIIHTATLHKPHVATHSKAEFVATNVTGTLNLLEACGTVNCSSFVFTSSTSTFGACMAATAEGASWVNEDMDTKPKNVYGVTKICAEGLCRLMADDKSKNLRCIVLRTSRFFPEWDDGAGHEGASSDVNAKINELLYRRVDVSDAASAHICAMDVLHRGADSSDDNAHADAAEGTKASGNGTCFGSSRCETFIISGTTPFHREDRADLLKTPMAVVERRCLDWQVTHRVFTTLGWTMFHTIDRVYDSSKAQRLLAWCPKKSFDSVVADIYAKGETNSVPDPADGGDAHGSESRRRQAYLAVATEIDNDNRSAAKAMLALGHAHYAHIDL